MSPIFFGMALADADPAARRPVESIDAAVILLVQPVGLRRVHRRCSADRGRRPRSGPAENPRPAIVERRPVAPAVRGLEHAADRDAEVQVLRIARVDEHRMQQLAVRRAEAGRPLRAHRVIVEARHRLPCVAAVLRAEQARRRAAGVPASRFDAWPGVSQKTASTERCVSPSVALRNAGGRFASSSCDRDRSSGTPSGRGARSWPPISSTFGARGSCTM